MLTAGQIKWAAQHDWFHCGALGGFLMVTDRGSDGSERTFEWLGSFRELRAWAGY